MTPVKNILDVMPVKTPEKRAQTAKQTDDFLSRLDRAAQSLSSASADRAADRARDAGRGNKQMQAAQSKPVENEPVEENMQAQQVEPEEIEEKEPEVFAAIPIFSAAELEAQQSAQTEAEATIAVGEVEGAAKAASSEVLTELMPEAEMPVMPEATEELLAQTEAGQEVAPKEQQIVKPEAQAPKTDNVQQTPKAPEMPVAEQEVAETQQQEQTVKAQQELPAQQATQMTETKAPVASMAESFAKQVMQEVSQELKKQDTAETVKTTMPQISAETQIEEVVAESLTADEGGEGADVATKQKEMPSSAQQPMTAQIAQDGKVDFKASMQELQPEQQHQLRQNVQTQIVDQVRSLVTKEKTEFFLQLKPEHLGGLSIMLAEGEKGLMAKLVTGSKEAHMMIQNDVAQIQESLRERGINVVQMEVVYDQMASATGKQDTNSGQGWEQGRSGGSQGRLPEDSIEGVEMPAYTGELSNYEVLAEQGGSVEFSA